MLPAFSWKKSMVGLWRLVALPQPMGWRYQAWSFVPSLAVRSTSCIERFLLCDSVQKSDQGPDRERALQKVADVLREGMTGVSWWVYGKDRPHTQDGSQMGSTRSWWVFQEFWECRSAHY